MRRRIARYRRADPVDRSDFVIGCRLLTQPFYFDEPDWIPAPASWSPNIIVFKTYSASDSEGPTIWRAVQDRLERHAAPLVAENAEPARYGEPILVRPRLGQGAFRIIVTDAYGRKCAVTGANAASP